MQHSLGLRLQELALKKRAISELEVTRNERPYHADIVTIEQHFRYLRI